MTNADKLALAKARFSDGFAYAGRAPQLLAAAAAVVIAKRRHRNRAQVHEPHRRGRSRDHCARGESAHLDKALRVPPVGQERADLRSARARHAYGDLDAILACVAGFVLLRRALRPAPTSSMTFSTSMPTAGIRPSATGPWRGGDIPVRHRDDRRLIVHLRQPGRGVAAVAGLLRMPRRYLGTTLAYSIYLKRNC